MEDYYRKIGILTCLVLIITFFTLFIIMSKEVMKGPHLLRVRFSNVGTLIFQEPVSIDGVQVGHVADIEYTSGAALVTLEFYNRIKIPSDSKIINFNHSMLGARMIFIERGKSPVDMDFSKEQTGHFDEGVAEILHKTGEMINLVNQYKAIIDAFAFGTDSTLSFQEGYQKTFLPLVEKTFTLAQQIEKIEKEILKKAEIAHKMANTLKKVTDKVIETGPSITKTLMEFTERLDTMVIRLNAFVTKGHRDLNSLHTKKSAFTKLLNEKDLFILLERINEVLKDLMNSLSSGETDVNLRFWGKNPTKKNRR